MMKPSILAITAALMALLGTAAFAQDDHNQQVTKDWYQQHKNNPPPGLRDRDRLSGEQESQMQEGKVLDKDMRKRVHPAPLELTRQLPPPPVQQRYVAIGGHLATIDSGYQVKAVIHLHEN